MNASSENMPGSLYLLFTLRADILSMMDCCSCILEAAKFSFIRISLVLLTTTEVPLFKAHPKINWAGVIPRSLEIDCTVSFFKIDSLSSAPPSSS